MFPSYRPRGVLTFVACVSLLHTSTTSTQEQGNHTTQWGKLLDEEREGQETLEGGEWHHQEVIVSFDYLILQ